MLEEMTQTKLKTRKRPLLITLVIVIVALLSTLAWYILYSNREILSKQTDVMEPYFLYLQNAEDGDSLQFSVGNIHPGETKQIVLAVSNHNPNSTEGYEISRDSKFDYQLELAYTTNLPVTYQLYQLTEQAADENADTVDDQEQKGSSTLIQIQRANGNLMTLYRAGNAMSTDDESDKRNREMYANVSNAAEDLSNIVNLGTYDLYETLADGKTELSLSSHQNEDGTVSYDIDYYLIEITPRTDVTFAEYKKETDLVYVIVKALQPRPVAETKEDTESAKATETDNSNTNNE